MCSHSSLLHLFSLDKGCRCACVVDFIEIGDFRLCKRHAALATPSRLHRVAHSKFQRSPTHFSPLPVLLLQVKRHPFHIVDIYFRSPPSSCLHLLASSLLTSSTHRRPLQKISSSTITPTLLSSSQQDPSLISILPKIYTCGRIWTAFTTGLTPPPRGPMVVWGIHPRRIMLPRSHPRGSNRYVPIAGFYLSILKLVRIV